jgi:phosphohistidine phosphatase
MKTLYILRHAKSSWDNPNLADFERPLNKRGMEAAPFMGEIIFKNKFQPDVLLSSPAKRAKQTAVLVKEVGGIGAGIQYDERIYEASPQTLAQVISELDSKSDSAMLVGHNPGLESLIRYLTGEIHAMPTAALAIVDLEVDCWNQIYAVCGNLRTLIRPKDEK